MAASGWLIALSAILFWIDPFSKDNTQWGWVLSLPVFFIIAFEHLKRTILLIVAYALSGTRFALGGLPFAALALYLTAPYAREELAGLRHPPHAVVGQPEFHAAGFFIAVAAGVLFVAAVLVAALCVIRSSKSITFNSTARAFSAMYGLDAFAEGAYVRGSIVALVSVLSVFTTLIGIGWVGLALVIFWTLRTKRLSNQVTPLNP